LKLKDPLNRRSRTLTLEAEKPFEPKIKDSDALRLEAKDPLKLKDSDPLKDPNRMDPMKLKDSDPLKEAQGL